MLSVRIPAQAELERGTLLIHFLTRKRAVNAVPAMADFSRSLGRLDPERDCKAHSFYHETEFR